MPYDLVEARTQWRTIRTLGSQIEQLTIDAEHAFTKVDGTSQAPAAQTITDIKAELSLTTPKMLAAWNAYWAALKQ